MTEHCTDCSRPMARGKASRPSGIVRHAAHGLCDTCYWRGRSHCRRGSSELDEIAVWRACQGDPVRLSLAERHAAHALLNSRGMSARLIAERLRCTPRTVVRYRHRLAVAA